MKTPFLKTMLFALSIAFFTACGSENTHNTEATQTTEAAGTNQEVAGVTYTCPMHPEVVSQEPGKCPKCGMNLEKATAAEHDHQPGDQH